MAILFTFKIYPCWCFLPIFIPQLFKRMEGGPFYIPPTCTGGRVGGQLTTINGKKKSMMLEMNLSELQCC